ncbi:hypothetical protein GGR56DRAFT_18156 [Xylariaceae sp. FL0804]|nr:hypothetical protein GGR56DRAFT_18156 [Xylariaceae sp. FL0804]
MDPTLSQERDRAVESGPRLPSSAYPIPYNGRVLDHVETRPSSRLDGGSDQERTTAQTRAIPFIHTREPVPRGTCVPEGFQPKVGRPYASHSYPHSSLSPIRTGLQDMLLPSVEPASPSSVWGAQNATRGMHRESQQLAEPPRVLTRLPFDASRSHLRPRSPVSAEDNHELAAKRRRVVTYDHEGLDGRSKPSFIRIIHPEDHGNGYARLESSTARPPPHSTDRVVSPVGSWGIVRDNLTQHPRGFGPLRTRTNPIVVNEDSRYMPYAAESQGPPAGEIYERSSARAGGTMQGMLPSESRRIDDAPHVRYVGRPAPQPTFVSHSHQNGFDGAGIRPLPDRDSRLHSSVWQRHHEAAPLQSHSAAYYTEAVRPGQPVLAPMEFSGNSRREALRPPKRRSSRICARAATASAGFTRKSALRIHKVGSSNSARGGVSKRWQTFPCLYNWGQSCLSATSTSEPRITRCGMDTRISHQQASHSTLAIGFDSAWGVTDIDRGEFTQ